MCFLYNKIVTQGRVKFPTGGIPREPIGMIRCKSEGDSKVWMKESFYFFLRLLDLFFKRKGETMSEKVNLHHYLSIRRIAVIAVLGALSFILMYVDFPLPFIAPPFYKFDLSEVAVLIGGFSLGPLAAIWIEVLKIILYVIFKPTVTAFVGESANLLIGLAFVLPAALIYKQSKSKKSAICGLICGTLTMSIVGVLANYFILLPAYAYFFKMNMATIVKAGHAILPFINNVIEFVIFSVLPFNIIKGLVVSVCTLLLYKSISPLLKRN